MKSTTNSRKGQLKGGNRKLVEALIKTTDGKSEALTVLLLIADMMDEIEAGKNLYMIIGATSTKTAYSLVVKGDLAPDPLYADSLAGLGVLASDLL